MSTDASADLESLLADWAASAVRTQELFDRAWLAESRCWHAATAALPPDAAAALAPLAPARQTIREHQVEAEVHVRLERALELRVGVRPVSAAARLLARVAAAPAVALPGWSRHRVSAQAGGSRMRVAVVPVRPPED